MKKTRNIVMGAVIAAAYAALCLAFMPIAFGPSQVRISEALTILPFFIPAAVPGLYVGCVIANFFSPFGLIDIVFGALATLFGALGTRWCAKHIKNETLAVWLAPLPPVIANTLIVGWILTYMSGLTGDTTPYYIFAGQVFLGEALACYVLGIPLLYAVKTRLKKIGR